MKTTAKAEETRNGILEAALDLFRRKGFEQTTIREIASEAGVATGAAYYYFASKEAMVMAFYERASAGMQPLLDEALASSDRLERQLHAMIQVKFRYFGPNRAFLGALLRHAADPNNPLSPFSEETRPIRDLDIGFFAKALENAGFRTSKDLAPHLPRLLWLYQMALIFFWLSDRSPNQARTARLTDLSLHLVVNLMRMSSLPLMRPIRKAVLELIEAVEGSPGAVNADKDGP
jgi:AcrR family transcriptional regulator